MYFSFHFLSVKSDYDGKLEKIMDNWKLLEYAAVACFEYY